MPWSISGGFFIIRREEAYEFFLRHDFDLVLLDHISDTPCIHLLKDSAFWCPIIPLEKTGKVNMVRN